MSPWSRWLLAILVAAALWLPSTARADGTKVGILVSLRVNVSEEQTDELASVMAAAIGDELDASAIAGPEARGKLDGPVPETCVADADCSRRVAAKLGVDTVLFVAVISLSGQALQLDVTAVDAASGQGQGREMLELRRDQAREAIVGHVRKWLPGVPDKPAPAPAPPIPEPSPVPNLTPAPTSPEARDGFRISTPTWIAAGATVASLGLGTTFALLARSEFNDLEESCPESCDKGSLKVKNGLADGFFAASAVGAGLTIYFLLTTEQADGTPAVSVVGTPDHFAVSYQRGF